MYVYAKSLQSCPTLCDPVDCSLLCPWDLPGKNTGVGCHFLLQRIFLTQGSSHISSVCCPAGGFFITRESHLGSLLEGCFAPVEKGRWAGLMILASGNEGNLGG